MPRLELVAELHGHTDRAWQVCWHPTSPILASCSGDKSVRLWRPDPSGSGQWTCIAIIDDAHKRTIRSVAFAPNGKLLATASFDASTAVWEQGADGEFECVATLEGHENEVKCVSWSASGALLSTCSRDKSVWIWEVVGESDFECLSVLQEHEQDVKMVQWHPNEELLASASYDDTIKIWREDDDDWYCSDTLKGHTSTVWGLDFDGSGDRLASAGDDKSLRFWRRQPPDTSSGAYRRDPKWVSSATIPNHHSRTIYSVSWSKLNDLVATCGGDDAVKIVEVATSQDGSSTQTRVAAEVVRAHGQADVNCVRWCPLREYADLLATAGDDGVVRVWRFV